MTDTELILAIQSGDESALGALYQRYLPAVWRYAYVHLAGNIHAAEDVVSETFLAAVRGIARLDPMGGSVGGWLIGIARHKVGDIRRHRGRTTGTEPEVLDAFADPKTPAAAAPLEEAETRACVRLVMDRLDGEERLALEWKYVEGLSVREIAGRLGRTEKAAEAVLFRARNTFRTAYERAQKMS